MSRLQPAQITTFHLLWLMAMVGGVASGTAFGETLFGTVGAVTGGIIGLVVGHFVGAFPYRLSTRRLYRKVEQSSNEELWGMVDSGLWNFSNSLALLHLAARGQEVRSQLPRIIRLLESEIVLERVYGWDALRLVFEEEAIVMEGYDPRGALHLCRNETAKLKASLESPPIG